MVINDQMEFQLDDYGYYNIIFFYKENVIILDFVFFIFIVIFIIFFNVFVVVLVLKFGFKKINKNLFNVQIMSFIVSDFMVGVMFFFIQIIYFLGYQVDLDCGVWCVVFMIFYMVFLFYVCVICLDRWWIIYFNKIQIRK